MPSHPLSVLAVALALSSVGLLGGPLILSLGRGRALTAAVVEGLTLGLVPTMVILRLLPHVAEQLGPWAIVLLGGSFFALRSFDRAHHRAAARVGRAFIYTALLLHSFTDGIGLAAAVAASPQARSVDLTLTLAFVIHRLPEGLFIATTLLPSYGMRRTLVRIAGLIAATLAGGLLGGALLPHLPERSFDAVVALGLGAMLQLVVHSHAERTTRVSTRALSSLALLVGVAAAVVVPAPHDLLRVARARELPIIDSLGPLFIETAPALVLALFVGALPALWRAPRVPIGPEAEGHPLRSMLAGLHLGARLPLGPGGAIPAARGLLAEGAPLGTTVAFTIASATLGLDGLLMSIALLGVPWSVARAAGALLLACAAGLLMGTSHRPASRSPTAGVLPARPTTSLGAQLDAPLRALDQRGAWYLVGLLAAAALEAGLPGGGLAGVSGTAITLAALLLSLPLQVPLVALLPILAVLLHKGLSPALVLSLGIALPAVHARALALVTRVAGRRGAIRLALITLALSLAAGLGMGSAIAPGSVPSMHDLLVQEPFGLKWAAAILLAIGLATSLVRLGPRLWIGQLALFGEPAADLDDHAH